MEESKNFQFNSSGYPGYTPGSSSSNGAFSGGNTPSSSSSNNINDADKDARLKKLQQQLNRNNNNDEEKKRKRRLIIWIILILLLLALIGVGIYFFIKGSGTVDLGHTIRLSIDMDEDLEGSSSEDSITAKEIYPGDSFAVEVSVRNSNDFTGDNEHLDVVPIFVRFKVELIIDDASYSNVIVPTVQTGNWVMDDSADSDGFYYYNGRLASQESIVLFSTITFDFANTENWMAGKSANIVITAEAVEGNPNNLGGSEAWGTAPEAWLTQMQERYGE